MVVIISGTKKENFDVDKKKFPNAIYKKDKKPSSKMFESDGNKYRCKWLEDSLTIHSDGNVSCGLDDPHAARSFGNLNTDKVVEVFANPEIRLIQEKLSNGHRCSDCTLYEASDENTAPTYGRKQLPTTLIIEPTVKCNLQCPNSACEPNNDHNLFTRETSHMDLSLFKTIIDQSGPDLKEVYFFNYGDPFFNRQAGDMLLYLRHSCPNVNIVSSTNGIPLSNRPKAKAVVDSQLNNLVFTISGVRQQSYESYHVGGRVELALKGLQNVCELKAENKARNPFIIWRYLVFNWNDTEQEIDEAINISNRLGVDQFSLYLTNIPPGSESWNLAPGNRLFNKYRKYISLAHGYPITNIDGMYPVEHFPGLGTGRWTGAQAILSVNPVNGWLRFSLASIFPMDQIGASSCFVEVGWGTYKIELIQGRWKTVSIPVPSAHKSESYDVRFVAGQPWYPMKELNSTDGRCLGVIVGDVVHFDSAEGDGMIWDRLQAYSLTDAETQYLADLKPANTSNIHHRTYGRFNFDLKV